VKRDKRGSQNILNKIRGIRLSLLYVQENCMQVFPNVAKKNSLYILAELVSRKFGLFLPITSAGLILHCQMVCDGISSFFHPEGNISTISNLLFKETKKRENQGRQQENLPMLQLLLWLHY
jgi:hypothetical protein